jgi:hypothetical protein
MQQVSGAILLPLITHERVIHLSKPPSYAGFLEGLRSTQSYTPRNIDQGEGILPEKLIRGKRFMCPTHGYQSSAPPRAEGTC